MKLTGKTDFFKKKVTDRTEYTERTLKKESGAANGIPKARLICVGHDLMEKIKNVESVFSELGLHFSAKKISEITNQARRERFTVAVVGEFSKGKSTFINRFLGRDILPVDNLPSTALLTRIRHSGNEVMVYVDKNGNKVRSYPLDRISWDGLTADNFGGKDAEGFSVIGVDDEWLEKSGVELIDTPGAGDLEESRAKVIGQALLGCDGAIITVSATAALSLSEKLFIEQRLISRKTPFLMMIVTKLDEIPLAERCRVMEFIMHKLKNWNMDIPIFIPYSVDMPDESFDGIIGMDKVKSQLISWASSPERVKLTEEWIKEKLREAVESELAAAREQAMIINADSDKRRELINEKERKLDLAEHLWEELKSDLVDRRRECYELFMRSVEDKQREVIERLQYEAGHASEPQRWWQEDYPYRLKVELTNMSVSVESAISKKIGEDIKWLNSNLDALFKIHMLFEKEQIIDKADMGDGRISSAVFEDLNKKKTAAKIGTTVATVAVAAALASVGGFVLMATMGLGTGAGIITEKVFKGKTEKQREQLKSLVAQSVPEAVASAITESEARLAAVYGDIESAATAKQKEWLEVQRETIKASVGSIEGDKAEKVGILLQKLCELSDIIGA